MSKVNLDFDDPESLQSAIDYSAKKVAGTRRDLMVVESIGGIDQAHAVKYLDKMPDKGLLDFDNRPSKRNFDVFTEALHTTLLVLATIAVVAGIGLLAYRMLNMAGVKGDAKKAIQNLDQVRSAVALLSTFHERYFADEFVKLFMRDYAKHLTPDMVKGRQPSDIYGAALSYGLLGQYQNTPASRITVLILTGQYPFAADWLKDFVHDVTKDLKKYSDKTLPKIISVLRGDGTSAEKIAEIHPLMADYVQSMMKISKEGKGMQAFDVWVEKSIVGTNLSGQSIDETAKAVRTHLTETLDLLPYLSSFNYAQFEALELPKAAAVDGLNMEVAAAQALGKQIQKHCKTLEQLGMPSDPQMEKAIRDYIEFSMQRIRAVDQLVAVVSDEVDACGRLANAIRDVGRGIYRAAGVACREMADQTVGKEYQEMLVKEVRNIK